jgi:hypothetical protein
MKYFEVEIPQESAFIIPIGDIHLGDEKFTKSSEDKLMGYLKWVKERENAFIFLGGDVFNVASRNSKTSPFDTRVNEYEKAIEIFEPYKDKILFSLDGNHENRMLDEFGISPMQSFCRELKIPYAKWSAVLRVKVGKREDNRWNQNYFIYAHHTAGGGSSIGGKLNRVIKLREIVEGIDVYCGFHNHQLAAAPQDVFYPSMQEKGVKQRRIWYVDCGSYLEWNDSYAEKAMMSPVKLGSPRIRLDGKKEKHDVHISI